MAIYKAGPPAEVPTHPGELLREDVLPAMRITVTKAAAKLGVSRQTLHAILAERAAVTPDMAVRLGKFCGNGAMTWLRMQQFRDLWLAERNLETALLSIPTMKAA
jgi:addiction module HigA family antidote